MALGDADDDDDVVFHCHDDENVILKIPSFSRSGESVSAFAFASMLLSRTLLMLFLFLVLSSPG